MNDAAPCTHFQFTEGRSYCPNCGLSRSEVLAAACEPYLKDDETPAECIARNRRDVDGCLTMLVAEKRKTEALQARLAELEERAKSDRLVVEEAYRNEKEAKARLAEAEALIEEVLRYPHKADSDHSTWKKRAYAFVRPADSASDAK